MDNMQARTDPLFERKMTDVSERASAGNMGRFSARILPWYLVQPMLSEVKYVLTTNGYIILP